MSDTFDFLISLALVAFVCTLGVRAGNCMADIMSGLIDDLCVRIVARIKRKGENNSLWLPVSAA